MEKVKVIRENAEEYEEAEAANAEGCGTYLLNKEPPPRSLPAVGTGRQAGL